MKHKQFRNVLFVTLVILLLSILTGCATKKAWYGSEDLGYNLKYQFTEGQGLQYNASFFQNISADAGGNTMEMGADITATFSLNGAGTDAEENNVIEISLDAVDGELTGMMSSMSTDFSSILGKAFQMQMSPSGEVIGFEGHENLVTGLEMRGPGRAHAGNFFKYYGGNFFPRLPSTPLLIGGTEKITYSDTMYVRPINMVIASESEHTLAGYEDINGVKCLKVNVKTVSVVDTPEGAEMAVEGDIESTATYYYDFQNGIIVKYVFNYFFEATTSQAQGGVMAYVIENKIEYDLVK